MLTRLEIDGFKNLHSVAIDFGPLTCVAGGNGAGKSNIFDVIEFLSLLSSGTLSEAAQAIRYTQDGRPGDPRDLFSFDTSDDDGAANETTAASDNRNMPLIRLVAEMIVPLDVEDVLGRQNQATATFLRYEIHIGYEPVNVLDKTGGLVLIREELKPVNVDEASERLKFEYPIEFRDSVIIGQSSEPFISTEEHDGIRMVTVHPDIDDDSEPRSGVADRTKRTMVSTITSVDNPTILAARHEMMDWQQIALDPSALRSSDRYTDPHTIQPNGRHLAAALYRIATNQNGDTQADADDVYTRVANRLNEVTDLRVDEVRVDADDTRQLFTLKVKESNNVELSARSLPESALRCLAFAALAEDTENNGVVCLENPENGFDSDNLPKLGKLLGNIAYNPYEKPSDSNPFRQLIINTHSNTLTEYFEPYTYMLADLENIGDYIVD